MNQQQPNDFYGYQNRAQMPQMMAGMQQQMPGVMMPQMGQFGMSGIGMNQFNQMAGQMQNPMNPMMPQMGTMQNQYMNMNPIQGGNYGFMANPRMPSGQIPSTQKMKKQYMNMYAGQSQAQQQQAQPGQQKKRHKSSQPKLSINQQGSSGNMQPTMPTGIPQPQSASSLATQMQPMAPQINTAIPTPTSSQTIQQPTITPQQQSSQIVQPAFSPPTVPPPTPPSSMIMNDSQRIHQQLSILNDERLDLFFKLFEMRSSKKRDERIEMFINDVFPTLAKIKQNMKALLLAFINQLNTDAFYKFKDPQLPSLFQRVKGCKIGYKFLPLNGRGFEISPTSKERKSDPRILASFYCPTEVVPSGPIFANKEEINPQNFGSNDSFYTLSDGRIPPKISIQFSGQQLPFLTWMIIQYVEKKSFPDIVHELAVKHNIPKDNEKNIVFRTPSCQNHYIQLGLIVEEIIKNGQAKCLECNSNIVVSELICEVRADSNGQGPYLDEPPEVQASRLMLSDQICMLLAPHPVEPKWKETLYDSQGIPTDEDAMPLQFGSTDEYINATYNLLI